MTELVQIARLLNRRKLSAAPCHWLSSISIYADDYYENYDYDIIDPSSRATISRALEELGFRQIDGRTFEGDTGRAEFPRPTRSLASDPARELEDVLERGSSISFATPTQVLLTTWRREGPALSPGRQDDVLRLVREQPANLDKIRDWLHGTEAAGDFARAMPRLASVQEEGYQLRRRGAFRSTLPR